MCASVTRIPVRLEKALKITPDKLEFSPHNRYTMYLKLEQRSQVPVSYLFQTNLESLFFVTPAEGNTDYTPEQIVKISFKSPQKIHSIKFTPRFQISWWFYEGRYTGMYYTYNLVLFPLRLLVLCAKFSLNLFLKNSENNI